MCGCVLILFGGPCVAHRVCAMLAQKSKGLIEDDDFFLPLLLLLLDALTSFSSSSSSPNSSFLASASKLAIFPTSLHTMTFFALCLFLSPPSSSSSSSSSSSHFSLSSMANPAESYPRYSNRFKPTSNFSTISFFVFGTPQFKYANIPHIIITYSVIRFRVVVLKTKN